jgi:hypothetical protein
MLSMTIDRPTNEPPVFVEPQGAAMVAPDAAVVDAAALAYRPVRRAAKLARSSAITTLLIGAAAVLVTVLSPSLASAYITACVIAVGLVELAAARRLRATDPTATRLLALNQLVFLGLITIYCVWQMATMSPADLKNMIMSPEFRAQAQQIPGLLEPYDSPIDAHGTLIICGFYGLVIVLSIAFQGGMALYYHTRQKFVEAFLRQPTWVRSLVLKASA